MILSLGIGLLGLGRHGRRYAEHLAAGDVPGARLVALWRRDRAAGRRDAARYGIELTDTPRMLCRLPEVNVVVLVLPPGLYPGLVDGGPRPAFRPTRRRPAPARAAAGDRPRRHVSPAPRECES